MPRVDIVQWLTPEGLAERATPANLRLGRAILSEGGVTLIERQPDRVQAKVGGTPSADSRRTVALTLGADGGLHWSCACTKRPALFCKHCVATALAVAAA